MIADPDPLSIARREANAQLAERARASPGGIALHRPVHVYLQVASACNLDCYMCSEHNRPESERWGRGLKSMHPDVFARIEREVFPWSSRTYIGVGGEPTIAPQFANYVRRAARAGQEIHLITNGTRFERGEVAEVVARHVAQVFVSMDAATPATYERIRAGSSWDGMTKGLLRLRDLRAQAENGGCRLTLSFVLMRSNVRELPAFVELAHELGATSVHAQHVIPVNEEGRVESLFAEPELYDRMRTAAQRRARELGILFEAPQPFAEGAGNGTGALAPAAPTAPPIAPEPAPASACGEARIGPAVPCSLPSTSFFVLYDGRVFPCCHPFAHQKMQVGDLRTESALEIWNGRLYRNLRLGLGTGDVPEICRNCSCVHDPPPAREDPGLLASSPDLRAYYGARDLAPIEAGPDSAERLLNGSGWSEYVEDLRQHASALEAERGAQRRHIESLESERPHLVGHGANLESERVPLLQHAANLEAERPHLVGHIANLERELADLRSRWTLRQRLGLRWDRLLARLSPARRRAADAAVGDVAGRQQDENPA